MTNGRTTKPSSKFLVRKMTTRSTRSGVVTNSRTRQTQEPVAVDDGDSLVETARKAGRVMTLDDCAELFEKNNANVIRRTQLMPLTLGGHRATTGSKKAQRRCNDLMIGGASERIKIVWSIDQTNLPPMSWVDHVVIAFFLVFVLVYAVTRFISEWNQWLRPPRTNKSKSYTPLTMLKPSGISMVRIVASEDQGVLVTKPTRKMVEVAKLRSLRTQQLRAHYSEPTRLADVDSSLAAALLGYGVDRSNKGLLGPPAHARTIAYSLAKFATNSTSDINATSPLTLNLPNIPGTTMNATFMAGGGGGGDNTSPPPIEMRPIASQSDTRSSRGEKLSSASYSTGLSGKASVSTQHTQAHNEPLWAPFDEPMRKPTAVAAFFDDDSNVTVTVTAASPPPNKLKQFSALSRAESSGGRQASTGVQTNKPQSKLTK